MDGCDSCHGKSCHWLMLQHSYNIQKSSSNRASVSVMPAAAADAKTIIKLGCFGLEPVRTHRQSLFRCLKRQGSPDLWSLAFGSMCRVSPGLRPNRRSLQRATAKERAEAREEGESNGSASATDWLSFSLRKRSRRRRHHCQSLNVRFFPSGHSRHSLEA